MKITYILPSNLDLQGTVEAEMGTLTPSQRFAESAKNSGIFLGLATVSIFIPVMHFILVPAFLVFSVVWGIRAYGNKNRLKEPLEIKCLSCGEVVRVKPQAFAWPLVIRCPNCATAHRLTI